VNNTQINKKHEPFTNKNILVRFLKHMFDFFDNRDTVRKLALFSKYFRVCEGVWDNESTPHLLLSFNARTLYEFFITSPLRYRLVFCRNIEGIVILKHLLRPYFALKRIIGCYQ